MNQVAETSKSMYCPLLNHSVGYKVINGVSYADWSTADKWLPIEWRTGKVIFTAIHPDRVNELGYSKFVCVDTGIEFKILEPSKDKDGNPNFRKMVFSGQVTFDLTHPVQRAQALILSQSGYIYEKDKSNKNYIRMENIEEVATHKRKTNALFVKAWGIINQLEGDELVNFARLLTMVETGDSESVLKERLEDVAKDNPEAIIKEYASSDLQVKQIIEKAKATGVVIETQDIGWVYKDNRLGYLDHDVINALKENVQLMSAINRDADRVIDAQLQERKRQLGYNSKAQDTSAEQEILEKIETVPVGDRSTTDQEAAAIAKDSLINKGFNPNDFMGQIKQMFDDTITPIKNEIEQIKEAQKNTSENLEIAKSAGEGGFGEIDNELKDQIDNEISHKKKDLESGIFHGFTEDAWSYQKLKKHIAQVFEKEEYSSVINKPKKDLFQWAIDLSLKKLEEGIIV